MSPRNGHPSPTLRVHAVSAPGSLARHVRVQYRPHEGTSWRIYGCYRRRHDAEGIVGRLAAAGYAARLIEVRLCPSAN